MASESTNRLREKLRNFSATERCSKRKAESDLVRFGLGEISTKISELENITEKDINGLASRIKRRKHASLDDMFRLSHAFLQSKENIVAFINIPGALNVIVKELTGPDSKAQITACENLCNQSLGDAVACEKIAAAAGTYLITLLDSIDPRLQRTSLWVITNILATEGKGSATLVAQQIGPKLIHFYIANTNEELDEDILIVLDILFKIDAYIVNSKDILPVREHLQKQKTPNALHLKLLFNILFSYENCSITETEIRRLVTITLSTLNSVQDLHSYENIGKVLYSIRIIGNLLSKYPICCDTIENECFFNLKLEFVDLLNKIFHCSNAVLSRELFWLIANMMSSQIFLSKSGNMLEKLRVPRLLMS